MVTQKGIKGITPYEKITYSHKNNWAEVLDDKLCVPIQSEYRLLIADIRVEHNVFFFFFRFTVDGNPIVADDLTNYQPTFCNTSLIWADEFSEYCNESKRFSINIFD